MLACPGRRRLRPVQPIYAPTPARLETSPLPYVHLLSIPYCSTQAPVWSSHIPTLIPHPTGPGATPPSCTAPSPCRPCRTTG